MIYAAGLEIRDMMKNQEQVETWTIPEVLMASRNQLSLVNILTD